MPTVKLVAALVAANLVALSIAACSVSRVVEKENFEGKIEKFESKETKE